MTRSACLVLLALVLLALVATPVPAAEPEVVMVAPALGRPAFGPTEVAIEIYPPDTPVEHVDFFLDGLFVERRREPPFVIKVDVGQDNREHLFEAVVGLPGRAPLSDSVSTPPLRSEEVIDVQLQQLYVTVEGDTEAVERLPLEQAHFVVYDQGVEQKLITFERGAVPFTAVLLIDSSDSMRSPKLETALAGAKAFVDGLERYDQVKLVQFSDRILLETPFTSFASVLSLSFGRVETGGGTAVNDSLYFAHRRLAGKQGRQVIVLLSDGVDLHSVLTMAQVAAVARTQQTALHWVRLVDPDEPSGPVKRYTNWRSPEQHAAEIAALEAAVSASGGRVREITDVSQVERAFGELLGELRSQYALGYYPSVTLGPGQPHEVDVRIRVPGLRARVRNTYVER